MQPSDEGAKQNATVSAITSYITWNYFGFSWSWQWTLELSKQCLVSGKTPLGIQSHLSWL